MVGIQREITERAIELLKLPSADGGSGGGRPSLILDVGCGSGLSGQVSSVSSTLRKSTLITLFAVDVDDIWNICMLYISSK